MKSAFFLRLCVIIGVFALVSCDKNKSEVERLAELFITAYNESDKAGVYELYPAAKEYANLSISGKLNEEAGLECSKDSLGYVVMINNQRQQRLVFRMDSINGWKIVDTYGVMKLDSVASEVALKSGVPQKRISDIEQAALMKEDGLYLEYLKESALGMSFSIVAQGGAYSWGGRDYHVNLQFSVCNLGSSPVSGSDYYLEVDIYQVSTGNHVSNTKTVEGVDLAPSERREITVDANETYRFACLRDIRYNVEVKTRAGSLIGQILKYCSFTGKEYDDFLTQKVRINVEKNGVQAVVNVEEKGFAHTYEKPDSNSIVVDTLYHLQPVFFIVEDETKSVVWCKVYSEYFQYLGFANLEDLDTSGKIGSMSLRDVVLRNSTGSVKVYKEADTKSEVVRSFSSGTKHLYNADYINMNFSELYERTPEGAVKILGYVLSDDVDFDTVNN